MPGTGSSQATRLLVVDDEEGLLFLMIEALRREGYEVEGVESGEQALDWLGRWPADLLLLDLKLRDLPAPALVQKLRERGQEFPFIVITGHGDERTAAEIMKQGALDYIMKDAGLMELLPSIVRRALSIVERERSLFEANEELREREQRHHKIIQTALDGFARFDVTGRLLEINDALCELSGYSREDLLAGPGGKDAALFSVELRERIAAIRDDGAERFSIRLRRKDASSVDVSVSMRCQGSEIYTFMHDMSLQHRLEREVLEASEEERRRIGRDLHDGLGQQLTALEFLFQGLVRRTNSGSPQFARDAEEISTHIRRAITLVRQLSHGLTPVSLEADGLADAMRDLASLTAATKVMCEFACDESVAVSDPSTAIHLYRIAQEAVNNALKHAEAGRIAIRLADGEDRIELTIEDDGHGFRRRDSREGGIGLQVMHYRARLIGGRLTIHSRAGKGVQVVCTVPKRL